MFKTRTLLFSFIGNMHGAKCPEMEGYIHLLVFTVQYFYSFTEILHPGDRWARVGQKAMMPAVTERGSSQIPAANCDISDPRGSH